MRSKVIKTSAKEFPYAVELVSAPDSARDASILTVGNTYVAVARAGSCLQVSTDVKGRWALVWSGRLKRVVSTIKESSCSSKRKKVSDETTA
jgi:hypothetical protein